MLSAFPISPFWQLFGSSLLLSMSSISLLYRSQFSFFRLMLERYCIWLIVNDYIQWIMEEAIPAILEDNVHKSANSSTTSNDSKPYNVCSKQPESFYGADCYTGEH